MGVHGFTRSYNFVIFIKTVAKREGVAYNKDADKRQNFTKGMMDMCKQLTKILALFLCLGLLLGLTGCTDPGVNTVVGGDTATTTTASETTTTTALASGEALIDADFVIEANGETISLTDNFSDITNRLGEPLSKDAGTEKYANQWAWKYDGFAVLHRETEPANDNTEMFFLFDDTVATARGVRVGDTVETLYERYWEQDDGFMFYPTGDPAYVAHDYVTEACNGFIYYQNDNCCFYFYFDASDGLPLENRDIVITAIAIVNRLHN